MRSKFKFVFAIALLLGCQMVSQGQSESPQDEKFVLVITLDAKRIESLRVNQLLKTVVPPNLVNRIEVVRFQSPSSFLSDPIKIDEKTDKQARTLITKIDSSVLDRLDYQPVEMKIYASNFSNVLVMLEQPKKNAVPSIPDQLLAPPQGETDSKPFFFRISDSRGITGTFKDQKELSVTTQFGDVKVPLEQVEGIHFQPILGTDETDVFVVTTQGDSVTGKLNQSSFTIRSRWGEKELKFPEIESLTLASNILFIADPDRSGRWQLVKPLPAKPRQRVPNNSRPPFQSRF